jgi:peptidoglycan/LPS O-acetylase OafA/YrhL
MTVVTNTPISPARSIPSLDGLRCASILLVILAHSWWYLPYRFTHSLLFRTIVGNGRHGVAVFFVISGYLITTLLMREASRTGTISLRKFYFRRSMRIFPPFYAFLLVMGVLWAIGRIPQDAKSFVAALTYTWALYPGAQGYSITHTWSLSIEEIFYVFWPLAFLFLRRKIAVEKLAAAFIFVMPLVRLGLYFAAPRLRGHEFYMVQGWVDTMMVGCFLALLQDSAVFAVWKRRFINGWYAGLAFAIGFVAVPLILEKLPNGVAGAFRVLIAPTLLALSIGVILVYVVEHSHSVVGRVLNLPAVRLIGIVSYSLYLWQQLFLSPEFKLLPLGYIYIILATTLSYWLVEKPSMWLRLRWEGRARALNKEMPSTVVRQG